MRSDDTIAALAPHVEARWRERFITELTLRGAGLPSASDALVEAETHCRESGHSAQEAFGSPAAYARDLDLDLDDAPAWTRAQVARTGAKIILFVAGVWAALMGASSLAAGERAQIDAGAVVSAAASIAMMAILVLLARRVLRAFIDHRGWFVVGFVAVITVVPLMGMLFDDVVLASVPAGPTLVIGIVATLVSIASTLRGIRASNGLGDPRDPSSTPVGTADH